MWTSSRTGWLVVCLSIGACIGGPLVASSPDGGGRSGGTGGTGGTGGVGGSGGSGGSGGGGGSGGSGGTAGSGGTGGTGGSGGGQLPPAVCQTVTGSFGGLSMLECVPPGMEGTTSAAIPLLVALHGYTQSADDLNRTSEWYKLAGRFGFYLVYAQAPGNRAFYWYTAGRARGQSDPAGIVAMVDHEKMVHHIDANRVFVTGLSAGGYMAIDLLADYPEVFAAGVIFSAGCYGCDTTCAMTPAGGGNAAAVRAADPTWWSNPSSRKPRLMLFQGDLDGVNAPGNMDQLVHQWTGALGIDATPDNAALGLPATLKGYPYNVYASGTTVAVATVYLVGLGHGTPVQPGSAPDEGGFDPMPGATQPPGYFDQHDWTNTGMIYGPYYAAQFLGLVP